MFALIATFQHADLPCHVAPARGNFFDNPSRKISSLIVHDNKQPELDGVIYRIGPK